MWRSSGFAERDPLASPDIRANRHRNTCNSDVRSCDVNADSCNRDTDADITPPANRYAR